MNIGIQLSTNAVKFIKGMSKDLNSIYYHRGNNYNSLSVGQDQSNNLIVTCRIELENCSEQLQEFNIAILIPEDFKEFIHEKIELKDCELQTSENFISSTWPFEFTLFNGKEKVKFIDKIW